MPAVLGLALAVGFACAVAGEAAIAGDLAARSALGSAPTLQRTVRVSWQGPASSATALRAHGLLAGLGLQSQTRVVALNPVRLSGVIVRPVAVAPLSRWVSGASLPGSCTERSCPMLLIGGSVRRRRLDALGVHIQVAGAGGLRSVAPLGFDPATSGGPPVLVSGDPRGLDRLPGLSGVYRTQAWLSVPPLSALQSWQLTATEARLQRAQAALQQSSFSLSGPFAALDQARALASAAPGRLLPVGGGALAALSVFVVLAAFGLRHDREADVRRLLAAGATTSQRLAFALTEAAALSGVALLAGVALGAAATALLAGDAHLPAGGALAHSLLSPTGAASLAGGWLAATTMISLVLLLPAGRAADVLAIAAAAALALTLTRGAAGGGTLPALLAPLACLSAGVLVYRVAAVVLRGGERLARRGPPVARLALISLARAPAAPSLAIAFIAVSSGLGGFELAYRATLLRGTSDQAADRVPLDALVAPGASFQTPLELAPLRRWRSLAGGAVLPVRRTEATFAGGFATVTVPALGISAAGLPLIGGWRASDGSAPLAILARRLRPLGPVRVAGPSLPRRAHSLALTLWAPGGEVEVTADLRDPRGAVTRITLGTATARRRVARARLPRGRFELEALELDEPTGLAITNGHQNGENPAAATQSSTPVSLGPLEVLGATGGRLQAVGIAGWRGVGAATGGATSAQAAGAATSTSAAKRGGGRVLRLRFANSGSPGVVRPRQPSDSRPIPVLVDPDTAAATARGGRIPLSIDGLPVHAEVVGVLRRFPTLAPGGAGFVVADEATLDAALDAALPGQGRTDELWIDARQPAALRAALGQRPLNSLEATFRQDVERGLRSDPIARGVLGTLIAAAAIAVSLALIGLLVTLLGTLRDRRVERDLEVQGLDPRALRRELRLRILVAAALGLIAGVALSLLLTRLAVAAVRAAVTLVPPRPPLVTVAPWGELALFVLAALSVSAAVSWIATASAVGGRPSRPSRPASRGAER